MPVCVEGVPVRVDWLLILDCPSLQKPFVLTHPERKKDMQPCKAYHFFVPSNFHSLSLSEQSRIQTSYHSPPAVLLCSARVRLGGPSQRRSEGDSVVPPSDTVSDRIRESHTHARRRRVEATSFTRSAACTCERVAMDSGSQSELQAPNVHDVDLAAAARPADNYLAWL
jgi:hypothetical protein